MAAAPTGLRRAGDGLPRRRDVEEGSTWGPAHRRGRSRLARAWVGRSGPAAGVVGGGVVQGQRSQRLSHGVQRPSRAVPAGEGGQARATTSTARARVGRGGVMASRVEWTRAARRRGLGRVGLRGTGQRGVRASSSFLGAAGACGGGFRRLGRGHRRGGRTRRQAGRGQRRLRGLAMRHPAWPRGRANGRGRWRRRPIPSRGRPGSRRGWARVGVKASPREHGNRHCRVVAGFLCRLPG